MVARARPLPLTGACYLGHLTYLPAYLPALEILLGLNNNKPPSSSLYPVQKLM